MRCRSTERAMGRRGKYRRTKEIKFKYRIAKLGVPNYRYRFTNKDRELQAEAVRKMAKKISKAVIAGSIPPLSVLVAEAQKKVIQSPEYQKLKDNAKKLQMLSTVHIACMEYLMSQWEQLPATEKTLDTFRIKMVNGIKALGEEARKAIKDADEIEHGKTVHVENKGKFEEELDKILDVTPEKVDEK